MQISFKIKLKQDFDLDVRLFRISSFFLPKIHVIFFKIKNFLKNLQNFEEFSKNLRKD